MMEIYMMEMPVLTFEDEFSPGLKQVIIMNYIL